jgi:cysteine desulfurase family protein (TIGR01976 family)
LYAGRGISVLVSKIARRADETQDATNPATNRPVGGQIRYNPRRTSADSEGLMDVRILRQQFAGMDGQYALFDNAGGSQILRSVIHRIGDYLEECNVQHGASYATSQTAVERLAAARAGMATWVNAADPGEVILGSSTTQLLRNLAHSIGHTLKSGDEIIVTNCDHEANIGPWVELAERGIDVKFWRIDEASLALRLEELGALMTERTRLVAWTHASNVVGRIHPVREFSDFVREGGALSCVDGVAYAPHRAVDVRGLGVDFYAMSLYKVFGPHISMLYGRRELLLELPSLNHFFIPNDDLPYKMQPGGANFELSYGLLGLWDYVETVDQALGHHQPVDDRRTMLEHVFDVFTEREAMLAEKLLGFLREKPNVRIVGPASSSPEQRVSTVSFVVAGRRSAEIVQATDAANLAVRFGDFYAYRLIDDLGLREHGGVVRVSMLHYNTEDEVDRLIEVLERTL